MKGTLVKQVKDSVALLRAATSVMTRRIREGEKTKLKEFREELYKLREENRELRREIKRMKNAPPPPPPASRHSSTRESSERKRRRIIDSEEEMDTGSPPRLQTRDPEIEPTSLPSRKEKTEGIIDLGEKEFPPLRKKGPVRQTGPPLKGVPRPLEAFPPGMPEEARAEFNKLMDQKNAVLALLDPIMTQMETLRLSRTKPVSDKTTPVTSLPPPVIGKEAKASNPQGVKGRDQNRAVSVIPSEKTEGTSGGSKKKKKGKAGGGQDPPATGTRATPGEKGGASSSKSQGSQRGPAGGQTKSSAATRGERPLPVKTGKSLALTQSTPPPPPSTGEKEEWTKVVGRKTRKATKAGDNRAAAVPAPPPKTAASGTSPPPGGGKKKGRRRVPRTAAMVLSCPPGALKETLRLAMDKIDLASLNIDGLEARKAVTGA
ncbi:serine/arginine repetitive matrix protein 1-like [Camponotus floridanus]|uniref:serine/arginine repetitive matrix protein 1-like n=1 Tax=Camponotus floridanus TaxID=104421 RepID=UPI000DC668D0|nr:serine/arginine repetitive matrix protein 1-like [Camponotus floridanus]